MRRNTRIMKSLTAVLLGISVTYSALAADSAVFPEKPVTMVVPFAAGGSVDPVARIIAQRMGELWQQPVVILNRPGAGGNIGAEAVVRAAADGYTLLIGSTALAISPAIYPKLTYEAGKDLAAISQMVVTPNVLVVHPSLPAKDVKAILALAKSAPGRLRSASAGTGSSNHLALVLFNMTGGLNIAHIPYKGAAPAVADVVGGHVDMTFVPIPAALPLLKANRLRALGVTTARRSSVISEVPTIAEAGLPGYEAASWVGMLAPAATPRAIIDRLNLTVSESLRTPNVREALLKAGAEPVGDSPQQFELTLRQEIVKWAQVAKAAGEKLD
jgi:tripartite-type tricarboxylate transporter receptor subunit TctC